MEKERRKRGRKRIEDKDWVKGLGRRVRKKGDERDRGEGENLPYIWVSFCVCSYLSVCVCVCVCRVPQKTSNFEF